MLGRDDVLRAVAAEAARLDAAVFTGNGFIPRALHALADRPRNFYMLGSMGLCGPLAAGFSHRSGLPVFAVEGDGNVLMGLSGLPVVPLTARPPFVHIVVDNQVYESTGGQRSPAPGFSFRAVAAAAGYGATYEAADVGGFDAALAAAIDSGRVAFIHVRVAPGADPHHPRVRYDPPGIAGRFVRAVR